jgi:GntR family transcriptional repressor for pyruvate dehydrogenase complex
LLNALPLPQKSAEIIADRLRDEILSHRLVDGDQLADESELCGQFGVSKPTLREALRILESESLLVTRRGVRGGPKIVAPSERTAARYVGRYLQYRKTPVLDVHDAISQLERSALADLAKHHNDSDLRALRKAVELADVGPGVALDAVVSANSFHRLIVDRAGNETRSIMHGLLEEVVISTGREIANVYSSKFNDQARQFHKVHRDLLSYIEDGDADGADNLMQRHLRAKARALESLPSIDDRDGGLVRLHILKG